MTALTITIPGAAVGKGRPRFGNGRTYTDSKTLNAEAFVRACAMDAMPSVPLDIPVSLDIEITKAVPASWSNVRRRKALEGALPATGKPDLDNVVKLLGDALNGIIWRDDSLIASVSAVRRYGPCDQTVVRVRVIGEAPA
ncbi:RusA family crossover junction endodeoxyribonuclease [Nguyenibacter vanlangensis]|uniref:RusA family crossover junction endodeoxyribonuclease n=1 Tax=Nguyenibacter vanlangensis TaxID=1216886 RepID=A0A7Y7ITC0_9PROT|nr:RusA family crossover junction endodeoxyribonuclease [Nguyenibacter vanlangensis]NVN09733.1 RusA family crossover junction endodeoxyribonuclease [Nguyenibacter vanlangensis]